MKDQPEPPRSSWGRWVLAGLILLAIVLFYGFDLHEKLSWDYIRAHLDLWKTWVEDNFALAGAIYFGIYVTITALSLPAATLLSLVGGALFGRWLGVGIVSVAATLGATLAFLMSRYLLRDFVQRRWGPRLASINQGVATDGAFYLFTLRLTPLVPFFLINLGMGLTRMRVATFSAVSWIGMLPGAFLYVNAGTELGRIESPRGILSPTVILSLALLGIAPLVFRLLLKRLSKRTATSE